MWAAQNERNLHLINEYLSKSPQAFEVALWPRRRAFRQGTTPVLTPEIRFAFGQRNNTAAAGDGGTGNDFKGQSPSVDESTATGDDEPIHSLHADSASILL